MASLYCQELIRNSKILCENYIGEILTRSEKAQLAAIAKNDDENKGEESYTNPFFKQQKEDKS